MDLMPAPEPVPGIPLSGQAFGVLAVCWRYHGRSQARGICGNAQGGRRGAVPGRLGGGRGNPGVGLRAVVTMAAAPVSWSRRARLGRASARRLAGCRS